MTKLKHLPSVKATGPDGITNRILQAGGEQAVDMIYMYMWEVQTYPGAWALAQKRRENGRNVNPICIVYWIEVN